MDACDRKEQEPSTYDIPELRRTLLEQLGEHHNAYPKAIEEKHPRILAQIVALWGKPELDAYLGSLMVSDRSGRQGFSGDVALEVFRLSTLYGTLGLAPKQALGVGWAGLDDAELFKRHLKKS
jgi:hypothetical protein